MPTVALDINRDGWNGDITKIESAIINLQEYLMWLLRVLDSGNIKSINTNMTTIKSADKTTVLDGSQIKMTDGDNVQRLKVGYNSSTETYEFELYNADGNATISLNSDGDAVFSGKIQGARIESDTTINVGTDLRVGNNVYIGYSEENNEPPGTVKRLQFFEGDNDFTRASITATKANDNGIDMRIVAPKIVISTLDGLLNGNNKPYMASDWSGAYVTINGVDYPVHFE